LTPGQVPANPLPPPACPEGDLLSPPLVVRARRPGDRLRPLGLDLDKKVGRLLTDARVPPWTRGDVLVVQDRERIVWVCPVRMSDHVKVTGTTRQVVRLTARRSQDPV
nr:tRNA lysidine(34) synthetase TilS [Phycisphaerae bacterium]